MEQNQDDLERELEGDWISTHANRDAPLKVDEMNDMEPDENEIPNIQDIPDMDEFTEDDPAAAKKTDENILKTRTYDLSITYDKVKLIMIKVLSNTSYLVIWS